MMGRVKMRITILEEENIMLKKRGLCFFMPKTQKSFDYGLKMFLEVLEFLYVLGFFKNDF